MKVFVISVKSLLQEPSSVRAKSRSFCVLCVVDPSKRSKKVRFCPSSVRLNERIKRKGSRV